jgi:Na+-transporting NADH:ubiquinone oxidoreductase subunit NqrB
MNLGKWKYVWERLRGYLGVVSLLLALRMNILLSPFPWWYYVVGVIVSLVVVFIDFKYVVSDENSMFFKKNKEWLELKETLKRIEENTAMKG